MRTAHRFNSIPRTDPDFQQMEQSLQTPESFRGFLTENLQTQFETNTCWDCPLAQFYKAKLGIEDAGFNSECTQPTATALLWAIPFAKAIDAFHPTHITGAQALVILDQVLSKAGA